MSRRRVAGSARRASSATSCSSPPDATPSFSAARFVRWMALAEAAEAEAIEPGLDEDDPVDLSFAGPEPVVPAAAPWYARFFDLASAYLPLLLMAVLAAGTWWLVRNAPVIESTPAAAPLCHEADYVMTRFVVQRVAAQIGRA